MYGDRAFPSVAGPGHLSNSLPAILHSTTDFKKFNAFIKTHLSS